MRKANSTLIHENTSYLLIFPIFETFRGWLLPLPIALPLDTNKDKIVETISNWLLKEKLGILHKYLISIEVQMIKLVTIQ